MTFPQALVERESNLRGTCSPGLVDTEVYKELMQRYNCFRHGVLVLSQLNYELRDLLCFALSVLYTETFKRLKRRKPRLYESYVSYFYGKPG